MSHERPSRNRLARFFKKPEETGFPAALNKLINPSPNAYDHMDFNWTPPPTSVQPESRDVAAVQASLHHQAHVSISYILPLLDGLKPLRTDADPDVCRTAAVITRMALLSITEELAKPAPPRVERLDKTFEELLGVPITTPLAPDESHVRLRAASPASRDMPAWMTLLNERESRFNPDSPTHTHSLLREVRDAYGLYFDKANTIDDEEMLNAGALLFDLVVALRREWIGKRAFFNRSPQQSATAKLSVRVSRQFDTMAITLHEAYAVMDSAWFGEAERDATDIHVQSSDSFPPLTVGELLDWVDSFVAEEGPLLLQSGKKTDARTFHEKLNRLTDWVAEIWKWSAQRQGEAAEGFYAASVTQALREIVSQLKHLAVTATER